MINFLYTEFLRDRNIYINCIKFWRREIRKISLGYPERFKFYKNAYIDKVQIFDGNPIINCIDTETNKGVRIIQLPLSEFDNRYIKEDGYLLTSWTEIVHINEIPYNYLVLSLFLTKETFDESIRLINDWLNDFS